MVIFLGVRKKVMLCGIKQNVTIYFETVVEELL